MIIRDPGIQDVQLKEYVVAKISIRIDDSWHNVGKTGPGAIHLYILIVVWRQYIVETQLRSFLVHNIG